MGSAEALVENMGRVASHMKGEAIPNESPEEILQRGAATMMGHVEEYGGHIYDRFGHIMQALFPQGMPNCVSVEEFNRMGVFMMIIHKIARYASAFEQDHPHQDSAHDLMNYAAILESLGQ